MAIKPAPMLLRVGDGRSCRGLQPAWGPGRGSAFDEYEPSTSRRRSVLRSGGSERRARRRGGGEEHRRVLFLCSTVTFFLTRPLTFDRKKFNKNTSPKNLCSALHDPDMSLALLPPRTAPAMLSSSPAKRDANRLLAPQQQRSPPRPNHHLACLLVVISRPELVARPRAVLSFVVVSRRLQARFRAVASARAADPPGR